MVLNLGIKNAVYFLKPYERDDCHPLRKHVLENLEDIIVYGTNQENHKKGIWAVYDTVWDNRLIAKPSD